MLAGHLRDPAGQVDVALGDAVDDVLRAVLVAMDGVGARVGLIGAAAATDFLDGWLARRVNAASRWGALIDPIADRFFVLTAVATMLFSGASAARAALTTPAESRARASASSQERIVLIS